MAQSKSLWLVRLSLCVALAASAFSAQAQTKPHGAEPTPQPAIAAILAAFDKYEVVGIGETHGNKDEDDFILSLIRNPDFPYRVNDIAVECGNSLYQPMLDRYIAGEDVPFTEVQKVAQHYPDDVQFFRIFRGIFPARACD